MVILHAWREHALIQIIVWRGFIRHSKTDWHGPRRALVIASANDRLPPFATASRVHIAFCHRMPLQTGRFQEIFK